MKNRILLFLLLCLPSVISAQQVNNLLGTSESFANGQIQGHWQLYKTWDKETDTYGHRGDHSMYNPETNTLYVITSGKNLVLGNLEHEGSLELRNQKIYLQGRVFLGLKNRNNAFRLIAGVAISSDQSKLHYSDDEGMTWKESTGGRFKGSESFWGTVLEEENDQILALVKQAKFVNGVWSDQWALLLSENHGESYKTIQIWTNENFESVIAQRSLNTQDCYFIAKGRDEKNWEISRYNPSTKEIDTIHSESSEKVPIAMAATTIMDSTHFYVACKNDELLYSNDFGKNWIVKSKDSKWKRLYTADPGDSKKIYCKTVHLHLSKDGGKTIEELPFWWAEFGWDVKTANWFKNQNGQWFMVLNNDFGTFFAENPHERSSWKNMNQGNIHQMDHHGASWDATDLLVTGNQDRGTFHWTKIGQDSLFARTALKADGLRISISNEGKAYWFIHYWPSIYHRHAPITGDPRLAQTQLNNRTVKNWYSPPMKPSWVPNEDAIYLTGEAKLIKLSYKSDSNKIIKKELDFDFKKASGDVSYGIETIPLDTNRLYVVSKNGHFFYSKDGGKNFSKTAYTGPVPSATQRRTWGLVGHAIEAADNNPDLIYWSGIGGKGYTPFLISEDGGITFRAATKGLPSNARIDGIAVTPNGDYVFGTNGYVFILAENKWFEMKGNSYPLAGNINGVDYLPESEIIRYYTYGLGVMDFVLERPFRGLKISYFDNQKLKGNPVKFSKSSSINLNSQDYSPEYHFNQKNNFGLTWTGNIEAPVSGEYTFSLKLTDGAKLWINKKLLINSWIEQDSITYSASVKLDSGKVYPIRLEYFNGRGKALAKLYWAYPKQLKQLIPAKAFVPEKTNFFPKLQYFPYDLTAISDGNGAVVNWREPELLHKNEEVMISSNYISGSKFPDGITKVSYTASIGSDTYLDKSFNVLVYKASILEASYYKDTIPGGELITKRAEPYIDYEWKREIPGTDPLVKDTFSVSWIGEVFVPISGEYEFNIRGDNKSKLFLNDSLLIDAWESGSGKWHSAKMEFKKGESVRIKMNYLHKNDFIVAKLYWKVPGGRHQILRFREE